jgi:hypothetical protein
MVKKTTIVFASLSYVFSHGWLMTFLWYLLTWAVPLVIRKLTVPILSQRHIIVAKASREFPRQLSSNYCYTPKRSTTVVIMWVLKIMHFMLGWRFHWLGGLDVYAHVSIALPLILPVLRYLHVNLTKKGTFLLVLATNTYKENRGITPLTLNVDTRSRWVVSFTSLSFYLHVLSPKPSVYMGCEAGWLHSRYMCFGEEKNISNLTRNRTPNCPSRSLVTIQENKTTKFSFIKLLSAQYVQGKSKGWAFIIISENVYIRFTAGPIVSHMKICTKRQGGEEYPTNNTKMES